MQLLQKFLRLFTDTRIYQEIVHQPLKTSLLTFLGLYCIGSLVASAWLNFQNFPAISQAASTYQSYTQENLPPNARFNIENGVLTTSELPIPYTIPLLDTPFLNDRLQNLVYINPQADLTTLATSSAYVSFGSNHARFMSLDAENAQVINYGQEGLRVALTGRDIRQDLQQFASSLNQNRYLLIPILAIPIFIGVLVLRLIHSLIYAALFSFTGALFNRKYNFRQFLNITLHTTLVAEAVFSLITLLYGQSYPTVFTLAFLGATFIAYFSLLPNVKSTPKE